MGGTMMEAHEARRLAEANIDTEYSKAVRWVKNAATRGEFVTRLYPSEFSKLQELHDKFVMSGFSCWLFNEFLEVRFL